MSCPHFLAYALSLCDKVREYLVRDSMHVFLVISQILCGLLYVALKAKHENKVDSW